MEKVVEKYLKIRELVSELTEEIDEISDLNEKIETINYVRMILHEVSPYKHHPVDFVAWEKTEKIEQNDYNPNHVAPPETKLLHTSIIEDGFTQPVVTYPQKPVNIIVDGFHRRKTVVNYKDVNNSTFGRVPVTYIRKEKEEISNRMASTIRHNRARGTHDIGLMTNIVTELKKAGMSDAWIMKQIGMDADEILRLKQLSGLAELFKDKEFSNFTE